jgi:hypothetical protein
MLTAPPAPFASVTGDLLGKLGCSASGSNYPVQRAAREQQNLYRATDVPIRDKASGTQLIQELITNGCYSVARYQPTMDKIMRRHAPRPAEPPHMYAPSHGMTRADPVPPTHSASWLEYRCIEGVLAPAAPAKYMWRISSTARSVNWNRNRAILGS